MLIQKDFLVIFCICCSVKVFLVPKTFTCASLKCSYNRCVHHGDVTPSHRCPHSWSRDRLRVCSLCCCVSVCRSKMSLTSVSSNKCAGGFQKVFEHERCDTCSSLLWPQCRQWLSHVWMCINVIGKFVFPLCSTELQCKMKFAIYLPPKAETDKCPVMYWLSGESLWPLVNSIHSIKVSLECFCL